MKRWLFPCQLHLVELEAEVQKQPWFLQIDPNGRIPAVVDRANADFAPAALVKAIGERDERRGLSTSAAARASRRAWLQSAVACMLMETWR